MHSTAMLDIFKSISWGGVTSRMTVARMGGFGTEEGGGVHWEVVGSLKRPGRA